MKHILLLSFAILLLSEAASAQMIDPSGAVAGPLVTAHAWPQSKSDPMLHRGDRTLSADVPISYYDASTPTHSWVIPSIWNPYTMIAMTQRITLGTDSGFLDSVRIAFDAITGDSVAMVIDPDTLILGPFGLMHLDATIFNMDPYFVVAIYPAKLTNLPWVSVPVPHVAVPKNFHVTLYPSVTGTSFTSSFAIRGDSEATRARTVDNARSTYILSDGAAAYSGVIDSNLTPLGDPAPLYSNLYITAYATSAASSVEAPSASSTSVSLFPNPVSNVLNIGLVEDAGIRSIEFLDALGRTVLSTKDAGTIDVSHLMPGRYEAILHTPGGRTVLPVMIQR